MMEPLSREQVDARFLVLKATTTNLDYDRVVQLEESYATLRAELTAMTEERDELFVRHTNQKKSIERYQQEIARLKTNSVPLEEHNRIVEQTITAMDAERVSFEQEIERLRKLLLSFNPLNYYEMDNSLTCQVCHAEGLDNGKPFIHTATCDWYIIRQALAGTKEGG